jgi:hypothetical protein
MNFAFIKKNYHITTFILLYLSLLFGFYNNETTTFGPKIDFEHALKQVQLFDKNFIYTFLNYDKIEYPTRISPLFILVIFFFKKIFTNIDLVRFILFNILILNQFLFYNCLKEIFHKKFKVDKRILFLISCVIFISPSFRSNIIWPESAMLGLLFFLLSLFFFLKNLNKSNKFNIFFNIFFLAIASYIRPSFCVFAIFFFYRYLTNEYSRKYILQIILLNLLLAFPAVYYVFFLDIFFIKTGGLDFNIYNKVSIISSIIFFHMIPIIFYKRNILIPKLNSKDLILIFSIILLSIIFVLNFDYNLNNTGGGIFLHVSKFLFNNNVFFFFWIPFFLYTILKFSSFEKLQNSIIFLLLFILTPQYHIFHKYYDPLVLILCFTILNLEIKKDFFKNRINIFFLYFFYVSYYFTNWINYYYIKF